MLEFSIPGYKNLKLKYLVLDYNGTLAIDGQLIDGVRGCLEVLSRHVEIHVLTADTFGKVHSGMKGIPCRISVLAVEKQEIGKFEYVKKLGAEYCSCIGNGRNDRLMLKESALGIAVILQEGAAREAIENADVICTDIITALELLHNPLRLTATLRS